MHFNYQSWSKKKIILWGNILVLMICLGAGLFLYFDYKDFKNRFSVYIIGCDVFSSDMEFLYRGNANMCVFLKNGAIIKYFVDRGIDQDAVEYFDEFGVLRWSKTMLAHHSMVASHDEKLLYLISLEKKIYHEKETKFDVLVALNMFDGSLNSTWKMYDIIGQVEKEFNTWAPLKTKITPDQQYSKWLGSYDNEFSHSNSINLVPPGLPGLEQAEIIVNAGRGFELFFTRDLKLLRLFWVDHYWRVNSHDAQITSRGDLLLYKNWVRDYPASAVEVRSLSNNQIVWKYDKTPSGGTFRAPMLGSTQWLEKEDHLIFTDIEKGGHFTEVDLSRNEVVADHYHPDIDPRNLRPQTFLTIRKRHYTELSKNLKELVDSKNEATLLTEFYRFFFNFKLNF